MITAQLPDGYYEKTISVAQKPQKRVEEISKSPSISLDAFDDLSDQCCCSICSETFDSTKFIPRSLDCGHTFCEVCINEKMCNNNKINCPICSAITALENGRSLPKIFALITIADSNMKSRTEPKVTCKACEIKFCAASVSMCIKEDCDMFNQLICLNCAIDGGHGGHVVKYDVKMEKIREKLNDDVNTLCSRMEEKKKNVLDRSKLLVKMEKRLEKHLAEAIIPQPVIGQIKSIASEQEAIDYYGIVEDLAKTVMDKCDSLTEAFDNALDVAKHELELSEDKQGDDAEEKGDDE